MNQRTETLRSNGRPTRRPERSGQLHATFRAANRLALLAFSGWRAREVAAARAAGTLDRLAAAEALHRLAAEMCRRNGVEIIVEGRRPPPGALVVANHLGYIDTLVLPALLPCTCVAKAEVARWPVVGAAAAAHGVLFIERGNAHSGARVLRQSMRALAAGVSVVNFPEGTTTAGDRLLPFRRGTFGIARHIGAPVVPTTLTYGNGDAAWYGETPFLSHYLRNVASRPTTQVTVTFGPPLDPRAFPSAVTLADEARSWMATRLFG